MLSPFIAPAKDIEWKAGLIGTSTALNLGYEDLSMAISLDNQPSD
jgi:hypothetical protein